MSLTPIEIIATIFAVFGLLKIIIVLRNKDDWLKITKKIYMNPQNSGLVLIILATLVFYYLIQELTIVQIIAASTFMALLMGIAFLEFSKDLLPLAKKMLNKGISGWLWIYTIIWVVLLLWTLSEIFL